MEVKQYAQTADLTLQGINRLPEAGLPIGNGRMGSLLWLTPNAIHMQINRVDVFGSNSESQSVGVTDSDFSGGCAFVDIEFGTPFAPVFGESTIQHLSVFDGEIIIESGAVRVQCRGNMDQDALLISIQGGEQVSVSLRALRYESQYVVGRRNYTHPSLEPEGTVSYRRRIHELAKTVLSEGERKICLLQEFTEKNFYCRSLVEIGSLNRCVAANRNVTESRLVFAPEDEITLVIASSQSFEKESTKETPLEALLAQPFGTLWSRSKDWWHNFWNRVPIVAMTGPDHYAEDITANIAYFYYLMASTSRGTFMPRYGGLLFSTDGDFKMWGAQYWWHNQSCYFAALISSGMFELAESMISHVFFEKEACEKAAVQQWGTRGMWIPETTWFNGPCDIPESLQEEFRLLYREDKPWNTRSKEFMDFSVERNTFDARFGWIAHRGESRSERGFGPFGFVNHIFSTTAKIAYWLWEWYQMTMDLSFLREKAYPIIKNAANFYAHLPLIKEGEDGKLHIFHCNNHEAIWGGEDTISELSAIHGILPIAVKSAELLKVDEADVQIWKQLLETITPIKTTSDADAMLLGTEEGECFSCGSTRCYKGSADLDNICDPLYLYDICTPETRDPHLRALGARTLQAIEKGAVTADGHIRVDTLSLSQEAVARSCDPDAYEAFVKAGYDDVDYRLDFTDMTGCADTHILENRMSLREGPQALSVQRQGHLLSSTANALCHAFPPSPGEEPVLYLFSALPRTWNAFVKMRTAKNYLVEAKRQDGEITMFKLTELGKSSLLIHNPWNSGVVVHYSDHDEILHETTIRVHGSCRLEKMG